MREIDRLAEDMPDAIKLAIVGLAMDPPIFKPSPPPITGMILDSLVQAGLATASADEERVTYVLTSFGRAVFDIVKHHEARDGTLTANDNEDGREPPRAA